MHRIARHLFLGLAVASLSLAACGEDEDEHEHEHEHEHDAGTDAAMDHDGMDMTDGSMDHDGMDMTDGSMDHDGMDMSDADMMAGCDTAMTYEAGMQVATATGAFTVELVDAAPAPPDVGDNAFTVRVLDGDGQAITDATVTVGGWMPAHNHGTAPPTSDLTADAMSGDYSVDGVNLFMPGLWEITFAVTSGDVTDEALFTFCLQG